MEPIELGTFHVRQNFTENQQHRCIPRDICGLWDVSLEVNGGEMLALLAPTLGKPPCSTQFWFAPSGKSTIHPKEKTSADDPYR
jgi:hypothetical protein